MSVSMEEAREARRKKLVNRGTDRLAFITGQSRAGASLTGDDITASATTKNQPSDQISNVQPKIETSNEISAYEIGNESVTNSPSSRESPTTSIADRSLDKVSHEAATGIARDMSNGVLVLKKISGSISAGYSTDLGSIVSFRPLLLVLLTDATIIVGPILVNQGNANNGEGAARSAVKEGDAWNVGSMLEAALVLQKALGAIFLDCCICAVITICGVVV